MLNLSINHIFFHLNFEARTRLYQIFLITVVVHILGMFVTFGSLVVLSIFQINHTNPYNGVSISMLVIGTCAFGVCLAYSIYLNIKMNPQFRYFLSSNYTSNENNDQSNESYLNNRENSNNNRHDDTTHNMSAVYVINFQSPTNS
jgi:hypothetical protein